VLDRWNSLDVPSNQLNFNVKLRYPIPEFNNFLMGNLTTTQSTNSFDFNNYWLFMNSSLIEVMSSISEQVIDDVVTEKTKTGGVSEFTTSPGKFEL
jgi:hypothetical protein